MVRSLRALADEHATAPSYWTGGIERNAATLAQRKLNSHAVALDLIPVRAEKQAHGTVRRDIKREAWDDRAVAAHEDDRHGYDLRARWLAKLEMDGSLLENAGAAARERDLVLAAVTNYGLALQWASADLRADRPLALVAVKQNGLALKFCGDELRRDRKLALTAARSNVHALKYAARELQDDSAFVHRGIREHQRRLRWESRAKQHELIRRLAYENPFR